MKSDLCVRLQSEMQNVKESVKTFCESCWTVENLKNKIPISKWLPKYTLYDLQSDIIAGLTVALTVIPQSLAYANIANLPPQYGLYSAYLGCFIYCFLGTSKDITLGPTAVMSLMTAAFAAAPIEQDPTYAVLLSLICGVVQLLMGVLHLGIIVHFISYPVINAFTSAAAITIAASQLKGILGLRNIPREFLEEIYEICKHLPDTRPWDLTMGMCCMKLLFFLKKLKTINWKKDPSGREPTIKQLAFRKAIWLTGIGANAIIVISAAIIASVLLDHGIDELTITGDIKAGLPGIKLPSFTFDHPGNNGTESEAIHKDFGEVLADIGPGLVIIPLLGMMEATAIGKAFARQNNYKILPNQELIALGVANIASSFVSSYPVTGSFSRTAVNSQSGVRTPASGLLTGALVILALQFLTPMCKYIPKSALAAVIIMAVIQTIDYKIVKKIWKVRKIDLVPMFFTFIMSFAIGIEYGILIGIGVSLLILLYPVARPSVKVHYLDYIVVTFDQGLRYPSTDYVQSKVTKEMNSDGRPKSVILDCTHISMLDYTTIQGIIELTADFIRKDVKFAMACVQPHLKELLMKAEIENLICGNTIEETIRMLEKSKDVDEETKIISAMSGAISLEISKIDEYTVYVEKALEVAKETEDRLSTLPTMNGSVPRDVPKDNESTILYVEHL